MKEEKVRFVIAGTGAIASVHAEAIHRLSGGALIAFLGSDPERVGRFGKKYGVPGYHDWETLCRESEFDAVIVANQSGRHAGTGKEAALKGKHLLIEKPMATTLEEGRQLLAGCQENQVTLGVVYQHRFDPDLQRVKGWLEKGELGKILWVSASLVSRRDTAYYRLHAGRSTPSSTGGGVLMTQGIHLVDMLQWWFGPVATVYGRTENRLHKLPFEDTAMGILQFENGVPATVIATTASRLPRPSRIEIHGTLRSVILENFRIRPSFFRRQGTHEDVLRDFTEALIKKRPPCVHGEEALKSLNIVLGFYESSRSGQPVLVNPRESVPATEKVLK